MKKITIVFVFLACILGLVGCKHQTNDLLFKVDPLFYDNLMLVKKDDGYKYYTKKGKSAFGGNYTYATNFNNGLATVGNGYSKFLIDTNGKKISENYNNITLKDEKIYVTSTKNGFDEYIGFIDLDGNIICEPTYTYLYMIDDNYISVMNDEGLYGVINFEGNTIIPFVYDRPIQIEDGLAAVNLVEENKNIVLDMENNIIFQRAYENETETLTILKKGVYNIKTATTTISVDHENKDIFGNNSYFESLINDDLAIVASKQFGTVLKYLADHRGVKIINNDLKLIKFLDNIILIKTDDGIALIDQKGNLLLDEYFDHYEYRSEFEYVTLYNNNLYTNDTLVYHLKNGLLFESRGHEKQIDYAYILDPIKQSYVLFELDANGVEPFKLYPNLNHKERYYTLTNYNVYALFNDLLVVGNEELGTIEIRKFDGTIVLKDLVYTKVNYTSDNYLHLQNGSNGVVINYLGNIVFKY